MSDPASIGSIAVVDVETTGLFPARHDRIVEIAVVVVKADGTVLKEFESLINPMRDVGPTSVHGLTSDDLLFAPKFEDIAGHVLDVLQGTIALAGHNVRFDYQFLTSEFNRVGMEFPTCHLVCTMEMAGGGNLDDCCRSYGVSLDGERHRAMFDALCASRLFAMLVQDNPRLASRLIALKLLQLPRCDGMRNPPLSRRISRERSESEITYIQRLLRRREGHAFPEATDGATIAYGALLDRALEDRRLETYEAEALVEMATKWGLDNARVDKAHRDYLEHLVVTALADGSLSDAELGDLRRVARLLGQQGASLEEAIADAAAKLSETQSRAGVGTSDTEGLRGMRVCFTGELQGQISGKRISREMAETIAEGAGLIVVESVTKSCNLLVLADPNSQSGKAKKARTLGTRIMHESVFWKHLDIEA